jgi:hypothetical protein
MKSVLYIILLLLFVMCNTKNTIENTTGVSHPGLIGAYISQDYLNALDTTKSTLQSQQYAGLSSASIMARGGALLFSGNWNFHEGGLVYAIKMDSDTSGKIFSDSTLTYSLEVMNDSTLRVFNSKDNFILSKYSTDPKATDVSKIVNEKLLPKNLSLNGHHVLFKNDGTVEGIDNLSTFSFTIDYNDAGMDFDKINLTFKNNPSSQEFGYVISKDTFEIYTVKCIEFDKYDSTVCLSHTKSASLYKMLKK